MISDRKQKVLEVPAQQRCLQTLTNREKPQQISKHTSTHLMTISSNIHVPTQTRIDLILSDRLIDLMCKPIFSVLADIWSLQMFVHLLHSSLKSKTDCVNLIPLT